MFALENVDLVIKDLHFVNKQNIDHTFAITDYEVVNNFVKYNFFHWESQTFETFELVKDKNSIAIDIGSWIGTTGIWLCKNFNNVICVEADNESIKHLKVNLKLSNCRNVSICEAPISNMCNNLIFGPRNVGTVWNTLNHSTSYLKEISDSVHDYNKKCITLKKILYDYVGENLWTNDKRVAFIKCDIEGGEAAILDDIFYYCLINNVSCLMSFHLIWWPSNYTLDKYEFYFKYFDCYDVNKVINDPINHIKKDPFCSILFRPKIIHEKIIKINPSVLISSYKNIDELKKIINKINKYTNDIIIVGDSNETDLNDLQYFVLKDTNNDKKIKFIKYLTDGGSIVLDDITIENLNKDATDTCLNNLFDLTSNHNLYQAN